MWLCLSSLPAEIRREEGYVVGVLLARRPEFPRRSEHLPAVAAVEGRVPISVPPVYDAEAVDARRLLRIAICGTRSGEHVKKAVGGARTVPLKQSAYFSPDRTKQLISSFRSPLGQPKSERSNSSLTLAWKGLKLSSNDHKHRLWWNSRQTF